MKKKPLLKKLHLLKSKKASKLDQFIQGLVVIGALGVLFLLAYMIYMNWPQRSVAEFLPAQETVAYAEISDLSLPAKIEATTDQSQLAQSLGQPFGIELLPMLESFGRGRLAYALIQDPYMNNHPVLFIQAKSKGSALKHFRSLLLPGEALSLSADENPTYSFPQGQSFSFKFLERYVAIAKSPETLALLDTSTEENLQSEETYVKSINNLPRRKWMLGYLNFRKLNFRDNLTLSNIVEPLKHAIHHVAFTVRKDQQGFHFNTFLNLNKNLLSLNEGESATKFSYQLTDYIVDEDVALYIGGANLEAEWQNTLETISNLNPAYGVILEGIVRAQANEVFGSQVDLRNDLYPLFGGEYAVAIGKAPGGKSVSLILAHKDKEFAETKLKKMAQGFRFLAAKFAPKISVVTLPDGTESRELVPDEGRVETSEENYEGFDINCTEVTGTASGFCYTVTDEIIIVTNKKNLIEKTIDLSNAEGTFLSQNASFRKSLSNLSKVSDEITYLNFDNFVSVFNANQYIQALSPLLAKLDSASWVKHYFTDGVSTEGYILVK